MRTTSPALFLIFSCLMFLPAAAEPAPEAKPAKKSSPAVRHSITRSGGVTEIVIHDNRPRKSKPAAPAPCVTSASQPNFQEVDVQAPRLQAVPRRAVSAPTVWTQDHEPGPASQAAANVGGTSGVSILPTRPYFFDQGFYQGSYGPGYYDQGYYQGSYGPSYYGPGAYSRGARSHHRGGCGGGTGYVGPAGTYNAAYSTQSYQFPSSIFTPTGYPSRGGGRHRPWYR